MPYVRVSSLRWDGQVKVDTLLISVDRNRWSLRNWFRSPYSRYSKTRQKGSSAVQTARTRHKFGSSRAASNLTS